MSFSCDGSASKSLVSWESNVDRATKLRNRGKVDLIKQNESQKSQPHRSGSEESLVRECWLRGATGAKGQSVCLDNWSVIRAARGAINKRYSKTSTPLAGVPAVALPGCEFQFTRISGLPRFPRVVRIFISVLTFRRRDARVEARAPK